MIINTAVPDVIYQQLRQGQTVPAKTNFENPYSPKACQPPVVKTTGL